MLLCVAVSFSATNALAQFGCGSAVVLSNGYTAAGITTPGTAGPEDWNINPTGTSITASYWDDDVYLFEYTAGGTAEQISMTIFTRNSWNGIGIFDDCTGTTFSTELDAIGSGGSSSVSQTVTATISAGNTVYIAVGQWGTPNDLDFDVTAFTVVPISCPDPSFGVATNVTATSADIGWTENGTATSWNIEWGATGFTPTGTPTIAGTSNNPEPLTGLTADSGYEFYVQSDCGGSGTSGWAGPFSFSTPCATITPDYLEAFASFVPTCWEEAGDGDLASGPTALGGGEWGHTDFVNAGGANNAAKVNLYNTGSNEWILSPLFDLSAGGYELRYNVGVTTYNGTGSITMGSDDQVQVLYTTDGGATWTNLETYDASNSPSNTGDAVTLDISAITGTSVQFAIWATEGTVDDAEDFDFHVTNFEIRTPPSCIEPAALAVANVTATTADVSWTAGNVTQLGWEVSIVPTGNMPMGGTAGTSTYNATGLTDNTTYDAYVREICAVGDTTAWLGPITFATECLPFDGDDATTPIVLTGLTASDAGNSSSCFTDQSVGGGFSHDAPDVWYEYTLDTCTDSLIVSLCGSAFDTYLTIYASNGTTVITTNDDNFGACGSGGNSHLELDLNATAGIAGGDLIYIVVDGYNSGQGAYSLNVEQIESPTAIIDAQTACDSLLWNGTTYTTSGQYDWLGTDANGCDSLVTLDLTISNATVGTDVITACDSLTWVDGITYYASINTPTFTLVNSLGCDSTLTLDLTIIPNAAPIADSTSLPDVTDECSVASITAPTATDACSGVITGTPDVTFPITAQGTTVVTWTFDDGAGLSTTQTQNVIITDVTPPTASNPPTLTVQCISDVPTATPGSVTDEADNCGTPTVAFVGEVSDGQTCPETLTRTYSVTDAGGNSISVTQTIIVNDNVVPILDATSLPTETGFCDVTPTAPTATDNCAGSINGVPDVTFPINTPGTTTVTWTFTDDCGNSVTQTQDVVIEDIDVSTSFAGDGITILASNNDPGVTYQWYNCTEDTVMTGETNFNFTPTFSADFAVIITQDGCVDTSDCVTITEVGIEAILLNSVEVYPNPVSDFVNVDLAGLENAHVRLLDMSGKVLRDEECKTTQLFTMEMNEAPGAYIIELQSNEFIRQFKLIKE